MLHIYLYRSPLPCVWLRVGLRYTHRGRAERLTADRMKCVLRLQSRNLAWCAEMRAGLVVLKQWENHIFFSLNFLTDFFSLMLPPLSLSPSLSLSCPLSRGELCELCVLLTGTNTFFYSSCLFLHWGVVWWRLTAKSVPASRSRKEGRLGDEDIVMERGE